MENGQCYKVEKIEQLVPCQVWQKAWWGLCLQVVPDEVVCIEEYADFRGLGRVALRDGGKTIAVGIIVHIISMK